MAAIIASASQDRNTITVRQKGIRGDTGANGTDGDGFDQVRKALLDSPNVLLFCPNAPALIGSDRVTWNRDSVATGINKYNQLAQASIDIPRETQNGFMFEGATTNLFLNSAALATQSVTVTADTHTLSFYGTGSITMSGAFTGSLAGTGADDRVSLTFTPIAGSITFTVTGAVELAQVEALNFASSYIESGTSQTTRQADIVTMPAFNNVPLLNSDFSIYFRLHVDNVTGGEDFIFSLPNGVNDDNLTVCGFMNGNDLTFRLSDGVSSADAVFTVATGTTYDIVMMKDLSTVYLYADSVQQDTTAHALTIPTGTTSIIKYGGNEAGSTKNGFFSVYDFRIYNFLLNEDEINYLGGA